ncbi:hypothetical protein ACFOWM_06295 [Ferruginibacter yonginensis]|uniref:Phage protein D n=1 Tax=Ferruginibacter yonginensis TaxID=1310416 RepID=A0ABV8QRV8_9BACT
MLELTCDITITSADQKNKWQFGFLHECVIVEDTDTLTDTCTIELPKKTKWERRAVGAGEDAPIKRGDAILVKLGYDGELKERFNGFVRSVDNKTPVKIICEDSMFKLKITTLKPKAFKNVKLSELIEYLLTGTNFKAKLIDKDVELGYYRITKNTVAEELNQLKKEYALKSHFRSYEGEQFLYVGFTYPFDSVNTQKFITGKNIVAEDFEYKRKDDLKVKVKATSVQKNNSKIELTVGDEDGEQVEIKVMSVDRATLLHMAEAALAAAKYEGLRGRLTTFGEPLLTKTDKCYIESADGNKGTYLSKKIEITFGQNGYRQIIDLGQIVSK